MRHPDHLQRDRAPAAPRSRSPTGTPIAWPRPPNGSPGPAWSSTRPFYCRHGFCPATIGNVLVYRDTAAHVTASYARTLSPYLVGAIEHALPAALQ